MSIIQQLEDLKEWAQNPERYERRLAFRGNLPSTEAGTIPIEWDELSDREIEYYKTGPWSTREDYRKGQLVQPGPGRQGYAGEPWRIKQQAGNIKAQKATWDKIGDAMWKANETGDFEYLMNNPELQTNIQKQDPTRKKIIRHKKGMMDGAMRNAWRTLSTNEDGLRYIANKYKMDVDRVLDIMEETKDFSDESRTLTWREQSLAKSSKIRSQFAKGEKWMMDNGYRFDDPAKFKSAYIKRFGRGNAFIKAMKNGTTSFFTPKFNSELMGYKTTVGSTSKLNKVLGDNIFSSVIYNMNPKVKKEILGEFKRALTGDVPTVKYQARKILTQSPLLKKFGLDKKIHGPISRLIFKDVEKKMYENIQTFRQPRTTTWGLLNYLEDVVDPKYKNQMAEARKAVDYAIRNKWKDAKKALKIADNINWDHKIPSFLIDAGYADELEYIKLQPTTEHFNMKIKNKQFDIPMAKLIKEYENAPASQKGNVITKMQDKIDDFSRQHGGYMKGVKVTPDKTGKPIFTSQGEVLTKKTDVVKLLKESVKQQNFKPKIFSKEIRRPGGGGKLYSFPGMLADKDLYKHLGKDAKKAWNIFRKVGGPWEAGIIGLDFINNLDNGMDADTAFQTALENFTMGIYKGGQRAQWEDFLQYGKKLGHNQENLSEVKNIVDLQKMLKSEKESLKRLISKKGKFSEEEIGWLLKSSQQVVSRLEKELDEKRTAFWSKDNAEQIAQNYDDTVGYYARQKYNANFDKGLLDSGRKDRVNTEMGSFGSPLWESLSDWRTYLPQNLMENTSATRPVVRNLRKLPGIFGDMWDPTSEQAILSAMSEEEKAQRAKELNIQKQSYHPVTGNTMTDQQMEPYYEKFYAGGGIATLHPRRPGALPPTSGPDSQGLAYLNNYATKRTE